MGYNHQPIGAVVMKENEYQIWWPLHLRVAKGETLSEEERHMYETGLAALESEELPILRSSSNDWRTWQQRWSELNQRTQQLARQEAALRYQAAQLEEQYLALTGEKLSLEV